MLLFVNFLVNNMLRCFYQSNSVLATLDFTPSHVKSLKTTSFLSCILHALGKVNLHSNLIRSPYCYARMKYQKYDTFLFAHPISNHPSEKITLVCVACLCLSLWESYQLYKMAFAKLSKYTGVNPGIF